MFCGGVSNIFDINQAGEARFSNNTGHRQERSPGRSIEQELPVTCFSRTVAFGEIVVGKLATCLLTNLLEAITGSIFSSCCSPPTNRESTEDISAFIKANAGAA